MMDREYLRGMLINGFSRFYVDSGTRFWSRKNLESILRSKGISEALESPEMESILEELESSGYIKLLYDDQRYLEVFDIDQIQIREKKTL